MAEDRRCGSCAYFSPLHAGAEMGDCRYVCEPIPFSLYACASPPRKRFVWANEGRASNPCPCWQRRADGGFLEPELGEINTGED